MPPSVSVTICVLLGLAALWGMRAGWRHRRVRTAAVVPTLPPVPAADDPALGPATTGTFEGTYVSSTVAGDWLERVVAQDLGVRSQAVVQVFRGGIRIERPGATDVFVPAGALHDARTAPGMAGKYVGGDGLVVLTWTPGDAGSLDTGLRLRRTEDRAALLAAARALIGTGADAPTTSTGASAPPTHVSTEETA